MTNFTWETVFGFHDEEKTRGAPKQIVANFVLTRKDGSTVKAGLPIKFCSVKRVRSSKESEGFFLCNEASYHHKTTNTRFHIIAIGDPDLKDRLEQNFIKKNTKNVSQRRPCWILCHDVYYHITMKGSGNTYTGCSLELFGDKHTSSFTSLTQDNFIKQRRSSSGASKAGGIKRKRSNETKEGTEEVPAEVPIPAVKTDSGPLIIKADPSTLLPKLPYEFVASSSSSSSSSMVPPPPQLSLPIKAGRNASLTFRSISSSQIGSLAGAERGLSAEVSTPTSTTYKRHKSNSFEPYQPLGDIGYSLGSFGFPAGLSLSNASMKRETSGVPLMDFTPSTPITPTLDVSESSQQGSLLDWNVESNN